MRKTLYLHIGMHKTGTTALQSFFSANQNDLADEVCYPAAGNNGISHGSLSNSMKGALWEEKFEEMQRMMGRIENTHYTQVSASERQEILTKLSHEIAASRARRVLLSSEGFFEWIPPAELRGQFDWFEGEIKVVLYLRRQDSWIKSVYNQVVKDEYIRYYGSPKSLPQIGLMDISGYLDNLSIAFGKSSVFLRLWYPNLDVVSDFFENILNLDLRKRTGIISWTNRENRSLPDLLLPLQRLGNRFSFLYSLSRRLARSSFLLELLESVPPYRSFWGEFDFASVYRESNKRIMRDYPSIRVGTPENELRYFCFDDL